LSAGSSSFNVVQQISPLVVSHSLLAAQDLGHWLGNMHTDCP
jgi:hypothetical protein